ncbi:transcriptional regulator NrdR [Chitinispirillales bacterium ANBcel5]|uniref:transcriptional regulator NrdR n=1 Tax=Cellulosispirillum alkaliphilum TaxID=3039283 RepID=UPI002A52A031|nr:transcriptional regulator NrdR [Chitinispirillales bacterium ANBcel5]
MRCPFCNYEEDKVVDSRTSKEGQAVRRRRECLDCGKRFTTYEYIESISLTIIKHDQRRESFDRQKLFQGIVAACKKRPISTKKIESVVDKIENQIEKYGKSEIPSTEIGKMVMKELYALDEIAYIRFASVYRKFKDVSEFISEVKEIESKIEPLTNLK